MLQKKAIDTVLMIILFQIKSVISILCESKGEKMTFAKQHGGSSGVAYKRIYVTPTLTPTPQTNKIFNGQRHNGKCVYILTGVLSYSIHIQLFSQNLSLFSLI